MAMMSPSFYKLLLGQTVSWFGTLIGRLALPFVVIYILKASALDILGSDWPKWCRVPWWAFSSESGWTDSRADSSS